MEPLSPSGGASVRIYLFVSGAKISFSVEHDRLRYLNKCTFLVQIITFDKTQFKVVYRRIRAGRRHAEFGSDVIQLIGGRSARVLGLGVAPVR